MDDELDSLEAELRALRPAAPRPELLRRIESSLAPGQLRAGRLVPAFFPRRVVALAAALAAALALGIFGWRRPAAPAVASILRLSSSPTFQPVAARDLLCATSDGGYVRLSDGQTAHRLVDSYLDSVTWEDPRTHASFNLTVPRQEVRVVPASFQ